MKFLVVLAVAVACASADVSHLRDEANAQVVYSDFEIDPEGPFRFGYKTQNGISAQATGEVQNPNSEYPSLGISGAYSYTAPDGTPVELEYVADADGFRPVGSHLPVAPEVPAAIIRSLEYIAAHPPTPEKVGKAAILG